MKEISKDRFLELLERRPRWRCFERDSGLQLDKPNGADSFNVKFLESISLIYEADTGNKLEKGWGEDNFYHYLRTEDEIEKCREWERRQGSRYFMRDCLDCSIALDMNFASNNGVRTRIGQLEYDSKQHQCEDSIGSLVGLFVDAIKNLPFYRGAHYVAAVPPRPGKWFDLPTKLAEKVAERLSLEDLTRFFQYGSTKATLKELEVGKKWDALEEAQLRMDIKIQTRDVILIDDKYQSGVTANYVGMVLKRHGAHRVLGLYAVKTMRNTDNL